MDGVRIREPQADEEERIAFVVRRAFGSEAEVQLVRDLRAEDAMVCELVAESDGAGIVAHVAFSRLTAKSGGGKIKAAAVAPLGVLPTRQRTGIGSALVELGLAQLKEMQFELAVVLGDPAFYGRFGFSALLAKFLDAPYSGDGFQAAELVPGVLGKRRWQIAYPAAFAKLV